MRMREWIRPVFAGFGLAVALLQPARAEELPPSPPPSLKEVPIPGPDLSALVRNETALRQLGKALFWDMQVGSDGAVACATCHFHAGGDGRLRNQRSPGPDGEFSAGAPNGLLTLDAFPLFKVAEPDRPHLPPYASPQILRDDNDRVSSQGVHSFLFRGTREGRSEEAGTPWLLGAFQVNGVGVRKVEPRNTPTVINAVFNLRNFWDGRANRFFNGRNSLGDQAPSFILVRAPNGRLMRKTLRLPFSSLASQALVPPLNSTEMSYEGRTLPQLGRKLLPLRPLARQEVHPEDSLLAPLRDTSGRGLAGSYASLVRAAFRPELWESEAKIVCLSNCEQISVVDLLSGLPNPQLGVHVYSLMEFNFGLFFGLALQAYESTLVSDDSPYDRFSEGQTGALTPEQHWGLSIFLNEGQCISCHRGAEFTSAGASYLMGERGAQGLVERMVMGDGEVAMYDAGFYNIGVRPSEEDPGVGGQHPNGRSLSLSHQFANGYFEEVDPCTFEVPFRPPPAPCGWKPPVSQRRQERLAVQGAFKTPTLRNVELTGPYMHTGGLATLEQVMDFYNRGGDFHHLDPNIQPLGLSAAEKAAVVAFLKALTDERVRREMAPFDHPQLCIPDGHPGDTHSVENRGDGMARDILLNLPAVGASGGPPLQAFHEMLQQGRNPHVSGPCVLP